MGALRNARDLLGRASRRGRYLARRLTGVRARDVVLVNAAIAPQLARRYRAVRVETLVETAPPTVLVAKCVAGDELPGIEPFRIELETVLFDIRNPAFSFRNHVLFDADMNALYPDVATREQVLAFREHAPRTCQRLSGTVAYLSNTWVDNYYHWLQLTLPLIRIYRQLRADVPVDYYYIGETRLLDVQAETLARLGIGRERIVTTACRGDRLLMAFCRRPVQHRGFNYRDVFGHDFVRALFVPPSGPAAEAGPKRLYVLRGDTRTRRILNEPELVQRLESLGFVPVRMEGRSVAEQAALFWNAESVVGMHGAALTNLLFARAGTTVIEIFPYESHEPGMFTAATHSRLNYYHLRGRELTREQGPRATAMQHTIVDLPKLTRVLGLAGLL